MKLGVSFSFSFQGKKKKCEKVRIKYGESQHLYKSGHSCNVNSCKFMVLIYSFCDLMGHLRVISFVVVVCLFALHFL